MEELQNEINNVLLAEHFLKWHFHESDNCFIDYKTKERYDDFRPLENLEDAFLVLDTFQDYVISKRSIINAYQVAILVGLEWIKAEGKTKNEAIYNGLLLVMKQNENQTKEGK